MLAVWITSPVLAQPMEYSEGASEFSLRLGSASVSLSGSPVIDSEGAFRFEPEWSFSPIQQVPQIRLGFNVGVTMVLDNSSRTIISGDNGLIFAGSSDVPLWIVEPELRLSWRQYLDERHQFFIEPGVAGGVALGFLELEAEDESGDTYDADDSTLFGRVFLRAGARVTGGITGIEASWLSGGNLDFGGNASGDFEEFYVGIFGAISF